MTAFYPNIDITGTEQLEATSNFQNSSSMDWAGERPTPPARPMSAAAIDPYDAQGVPRAYFTALERLHQALRSDMHQNFVMLESAIREQAPGKQRASAESNDVLQTAATSLWSSLGFKNSSRAEALPDHTFDSIRLEIQRLKEKNETLVAEKASLEEEFNRNLTSLTQRGKELQEANQRVRGLQDQSSKYRSIILKIGKDETEIRDDVVHTQFVELRDIIQRIVHSHYSVKDMKPPKLSHDAIAQEQRQFREALTARSSEALQRFLMRAKIFELLDRWLLSACTFGLKSFEQWLGDFEKAVMSTNRGRQSSVLPAHTSLTHSSVSQTDMAEWRSRTIGCSAVLDETSKWPDRTVEDILNFMKPQTNLASRAGDGRRTLERRMEDLCDKAYELSLLFRRSKKAHFKVVAMNHMTITEGVEAMVNPQAFEGPSSPTVLGSTITMTVFGALSKSSDEVSKERIYLEKAQVVCRA